MYLEGSEVKKKEQFRAILQGIFFLKKVFKRLTSGLTIKFWMKPWQLVCYKFIQQTFKLE